MTAEALAEQFVQRVELERREFAIRSSTPA